MIEAIVGFRDAVFAALVAWTGAGEGGESPQAAKDKEPRGKSAPIEKPVNQAPPRLY